MPLQSVGHMQIVDKCAPKLIRVENNMYKSHETRIGLGHDGESVLSGNCHSASPNLQAIGDDVAIEIRVRIRASVVTTPAISVEKGHLGRVSGDANAIQHVRFARHVAPHRSWRWHRGKPRVSDRQWARSLGSSG